MYTPAELTSATTHDHSIVLIAAPRRDWATLASALEIEDTLLPVRAQRERREALESLASQSVALTIDDVLAGKDRETEVVAWLMSDLDTIMFALVCLAAQEPEDHRYIMGLRSRLRKQFEMLQQAA